MTLADLALYHHLCGRRSPETGRFRETRLFDFLRIGPMAPRTWRVSATPEEKMMGLSSRVCPDCERRVKTPFEKTVTGREVCADCAKALVFGSSAAVITGNTGAGLGVWAALMYKLRRRPSDGR
jgi:hypothetical protein